MSSLEAQIALIKEDSAMMDRILSELDGMVETMCESYTGPDPDAFREKLEEAEPRLRKALFGVI
jgi:hypothetical protein